MGVSRSPGVSCPSPSFCAASDQIGGVFTSTNPAGGAASWTRMVVSSSGGLTAIDCPTVSLCVATGVGDDTGSDADVPPPPAAVLWVSTNPTGGPDTWHQVALPDDYLGPECGKYGGYSFCANGLIALACPAASLCVAMDEYGRTFTSTTPGVASPVAWEQSSPNFAGGQGIGDTNAAGLACTATPLCLASYADAGGSYLAGWNPRGWPTSPRLVAPANRFDGDAGLGHVWCSDPSLCFVQGASGLYASAEPALGAGSWAVVTRHQPGLTALSCAARLVCLAFDGAGRLLLGSPFPSVHSFDALIRAQLTPRGEGARRARVLRSRRFITAYTLPSQGTLMVRWMTRGHHRSLIATGTTRFTQGQTRQVALRLTRIGRTLLSTLRRVPVEAEATFVAARRLRPAATSEFTLR
jgi:hypothetical protein